MAVSTTNVFNLYDYSGTDTYPVTFQFFEPSELKVTKVSASGVKTPWSLGTHYTVTGGKSGAIPGTGNVISDPLYSLVSGDRLLIERITDQRQSTVHSSNDAFPPKTVEGAYDHATLLAQEALLAGKRSVKRSLLDYTANGSPDLPLGQAGMLLGWDAAGTSLTNYLLTDMSPVDIPTALFSLEYYPETYGAKGDGVTEDQVSIQAAINAAYAAGGGKVVLSAKTYGIGISGDPADLNTTATGGTSHLGLVMKDNVQLIGQGRATVLKRIVSSPLVMVDFYRCRFAKVHNLFVDGNMRTYAVSGATYGSGSGLFVESHSSSEDRGNVIDTVWVEDTGGYGLGVQWGFHHGLTVKNLYIDGTWSDGIDLKTFTNIPFDDYGIVLDNIHIQNFGMGATDDYQTGLDIRGHVTASNIHVRKYGAKASDGIRLRGGINTDNAFGAQKASLNNFYIEYDGTGGTSSVYGISIEPGDCNVSNGHVSGAMNNVNFILAGLATSATRMSVSNVHSYNATNAGFAIISAMADIDFFGCMDYQSNIGIYVAGSRCRFFGPVVEKTTGTCISIQASANGTQIYGPSFPGAATTTVSDAGSNTLILGHPNNTADKLPGGLSVFSVTARDSMAIVSAGPFLGLTYSVNGAKAQINATSASGSLNISADTDNAIAGSAIRLNVDGALVATVGTGLIAPGTSGAVDLGSATLPFGNLFVKATGKLDFNNGDVTVTHATDKLTFAGAANGYAFDTKAAIGTTTLFTGAAGAAALCVSGLVGTVNGYFANDANPVIIESVKSRNATVGSHTVVQSADSIAEWRIEGSDGTNFIRLGQMRWTVDGTPNTNDMPGRLGLFTTPSGSATPVERLRITSAGSVVNNASGSALATNATAGFTYIPSCAGAPTGVPGAFTGAVPMVYDSTNNNFYIYNGAWKKVLLS